MKSIDELEKYFEEECFSFAGLSIGKHQAVEGYIIETNIDSYDFCYSERGNKIVLKSFYEERELVAYVYGKITADRWNKAYLVARSWSEKEIQQAECELKSKNIEFERNDVVNYSKGKTIYRIFVFGKDVKILDDFVKKYNK